MLRAFSAGLMAGWREAKLSEQGKLLAFLAGAGVALIAGLAAGAV